MADEAGTLGFPKQRHLRSGICVTPSNGRRLAFTTKEQARNPLRALERRSSWVAVPVGREAAGVDLGEVAAVGQVEEVVEAVPHSSRPAGAVHRPPAAGRNR